MLFINTTTPMISPLLTSKMFLDMDDGTLFTARMQMLNTIIAWVGNVVAAIMVYTDMKRHNCISIAIILLTILAYELASLFF